MHRTIVSFGVSSGVSSGDFCGTCLGVLLTSASLLLSPGAQAQETRPVLPSEEQVRWADAEIGVIIHLDINVFAPETFDYARRETLPPLTLFNPSNLSTDQWLASAWNAGTSVGHKFIGKFDEVKASVLRLRITESSGEPALKEFSAYSAN